MIVLPFTTWILLVVAAVVKVPVAVWVVVAWAAGRKSRKTARSRQKILLIVFVNSHLPNYSSGILWSLRLLSAHVVCPRSDPKRPSYLASMSLNWIEPQAESNYY